MEVITIPVGLLDENCYIAYQGEDAVVIDPGDDAARIEDEINKNGLHVAYILLTHGHFDHIGAVEALRKFTGAPVCVHADDAEMLTSAGKNVSSMIGRPFTAAAADILLQDGQNLQAGGMEIKVLHTPGHTPGGVCFLIGDSLFSGDTLFAGSVGRTDFSGGSINMLYKSLDTLKQLDQDYTVYPGHGPQTSLEQEKRSNPFMRGV